MLETANLADIYRRIRKGIFAYSYLENDHKHNWLLKHESAYFAGLVFKPTFIISFEQFMRSNRECRKMVKSDDPKNHYAALRRSKNVSSCVKEIKCRVQNDKSFMLIFLHELKKL